MVLVHVLKRRPVRRLWVAGLVCCVLLGVELGLDVLYAKRGPVHGLLQLLVRLEIKAFLYLVLLGGVLYGLWYVYQQQLFLQRALTEERRRIARELHDGVGFQLVHALAQCTEQAPNAPQMRLALEQALIELHAAVDLMQPDSYCLVERLAGLRYRIQPALNYRGIELVWRIADGMDMQWLPAQSTVHVLKIVQEALGNILRHTHATRVEVLLEPLHRQAGLLLEVRDNGHGFTVPDGHAAPATGHGLVGMRRRAQLLGGTLQILGPPAVQGTCIRLVVTPQCLPERRRRARHAPR